MEEYIIPRRKRIPYGMMNFAVIRRDDCYYVDKTRFIPMIEEADKFFFFIRPCRFGKSLTVNMLQHYYDILAKNKFDALFDDLYIGKHPTPWPEQVFGAVFNFAGIVGELHNYRKRLDAHCGTTFENFCKIYADYLPQDTVDELIEIIKPWYDNYCFTEECYGETTMYNSNMVLYFVKNYIQRGKAPRDMVEDNIRIDYEKLRMLIRKDKEFAHDASIIQTLVSEGYVTGELKKGFPAVNITNPDNFVSLLYYFGMLTISGTYKGKTKLTIPNQVVREQIYTYLLSTYNEAELNFSSYEKNELASALAYDGDWKAYFGYIADCLKHYTSQRDKQKGEFFVHGFTLAMTAQNRFYRPISEQDTQAGYVDIFLCPLLDIYSGMKHSYIVELKYAKYKDPESRVEELRLEGITQANRYAETETVKNVVGATQLHKIVVVYKGMDMPVCEEI